MTNLKEKIKAAQINLIKELGIDKLKKEQQEKIILQIGEIIQQRVVMRIIEELADEKQDEFKGILDKASENPKLVDDFLTQNVPGIENMILEEIGDYKQGAVEFMKKALEGDSEGQTKQEPSLTEDEQPVSSEFTSKEKVVIEEPTEQKTGERIPEQNSDNEAGKVQSSPETEVSGIEEEQAQKEAQILEENKIDNEVIKGEELDLTTEIEKMKTEDK